MRKYNLTINDNKYEVVIKESNLETATVEVNGKEHVVNINEVKSLALPAAEEKTKMAPIKTPPKAEAARPAPPSKPGLVGPGTVTAPIPGQIKGFFVKEGDTVTVDQKLLVMEAMKMENVITATTGGIVEEIFVGDGDTVDQDQPLIKIGG
jgi:biotin carboxyl carrier protein